MKAPPQISAPLNALLILGAGCVLAALELSEPPNPKTVHAVPAKAAAAPVKVKAKATPLKEWPGAAHQARSGRTPQPLEP